MYQIDSICGKQEVKYGIVRIMSLNCAEIDLILAELSLSGSFIQNIVQPSFDTLALYTYLGATENRPSQSKVVLLCLAPGACRICETRRKIPKTQKPLRFMEFCKSRLKGAKILQVHQCGSERIIQISLDRSGELLFMYIRFWSGASNIIVTDAQGLILDVFYRRPKRKEISGEHWAVPEPQTQNNKTFECRELPGVGSFNERIDCWYAEHAQSLSREALLQEAERRYQMQQTKLQSALNKLKEKRQGFLNADQWRLYGDLLTSHLWALKPNSSFVELEDYEHDNRLIRISLDPTKTPQENAFLYYEKYRKANSGLHDLEDDILSTEHNLVRLKQDLESLYTEQNPLVIQQKLLKQNTPKQQIKKKYPGITFVKDGWTLLVGRTAAENDELLRHFVRGSDLWLHTRDWPGSYVFIKQKAKKTIPLDILLDAGNLALFYSKGRKAGQADLYYTQVKYLRRAKNAPKGRVLPTQERNLSISLDESKLKVLQACRLES